jgi:hypothetical protein
MPLIHWFPRLPEYSAVRSFGLAPIRSRQNRKSPSGCPCRSRNLSRRLAGVALCLSLMSSQAWGHVETEQKEETETIVAAGFGYQNGAESTITVKVYDAASGEVLSEDVYELSVKEDNRVGSNSSEGRIFAGGVGFGATDLSSFVLRVYDAKTGEFQWTGQLNLTPSDGSEAGHLISTVMPRRASVTKIHGPDAVARHPLFVLRAVDASTGGVIWEDEFSADGAGAAQARQTVARQAGLVEEGAPQINTFDFRIRMLDRNGQTVLWEDQVFQQQADEDVHGAVDDRAQMLPAWMEPIEQDSMSEEI